MTVDNGGASIIRSITWFAFLGLLCGVVSAAVFGWWWSTQPKSYVRYIGSYEPLTDVPQVVDPDSPLIDLGSADPWPTLIVALVVASTAVGALAGVLVVLVTRYRSRGIPDRSPRSP